jgi:hypothetical protein
LKERKYNTLKNGAIIGRGDSLKVIRCFLLIHKGGQRRRYFKTRCLFCKTKQLRRYDKSPDQYRCIHKCESNLDLLSLSTPNYIVLGFAKNRGKHPYWACRCKCGVKFLRASHILRLGTVIGCGKCSKVIRPNKRRPNSLHRCLQRVYEREAVRRNLIFKLSQTHFDNLIKQNCHYCGIAPFAVFKRKGYANEFLIFNGLDRKNNKKGYTLTNTVPCCKHCNFAKRDRPYNDFLYWINRIKQHDINT